MTDENKNIVGISIEIVDVKNLRGLRGDVVTTSVKIEFRDKVLGESPKIDCKLEEPAELNYKVNLSVNTEDYNLLDELTYRPVILTIIESIPKEKKQKDDKSQILGQCTFDLLPLLRGNQEFEQSIIINSVPGSPLEQLMNETPQPTVNVMVKCESLLVSEEIMNNLNILTVNMESLYSPPESFVPGTAGILYAAALSFPSTEEKENVLVFPSGNIKLPTEKDNKKLKWINAGSAVGDAAFIPQCNVSNDDYENEDGELKDKNSRQHRTASEREKNRVTWNTQRRTLLQDNSIKLLQSRIAKYRKWPIEIFRLGGGTINKTRKEEESAVNFHGYAMVNLSPLLFPGVKRIRGAFKVIAFNEADYTQMTGRKTANTEEAIRISNTLMHQSSPSMAGKKVDKKAEKKPPPPKVSGSSMGQNLDPNQSNQDTSGLGMGPGGVVAESPMNPEGLQYEESESYVMLEISLDRPLVEKRKPEEIALRVSEYIPKRDPMSKRLANADKAIDDYHTQVASISKQLLTEFRSLFEEELKDPEILNNQEAVEQMKQELLYDLNSTGKYFAFKEQLKYAVTKIVREKSMRTSTITDPEELHEFLRELFVYLVDELQTGLRRVITLKETPSNTTQSESDSVTISPQQLLQFAREAETNVDHVLADRYYRERLARDKSCPEYWLDYGCYLMGASHSNPSVATHLDAAENCFKECIALSPQNLNALVLYGIICALQSRIEEAETFFEAASTYHPASIFAWTCRALFYYSISNDIQYEMTIQEATRLNNPIKVNPVAPKEDITQEIQGDDEVKIDDEEGENRNIGNQGEVEPGMSSPTNKGENKDQMENQQEIVDNELISPTNQEPLADITNASGIVEKESVITSTRSQPIKRSQSVQHNKVNMSPSGKSKSSSKEIDKDSKEEKAIIQDIDNYRSIFIKTAQVLLKFKAYEFVEKALAQELVYQSEMHDFLTQDQQKTIRAEYTFLLARTKMGFDQFQEAEEALFETAGIQYDSADTWAQLGHLRFLVNDHEAAKSCFTRALTLTTDLSEPHPVYMRLASLYLIEKNYMESKQTFLYASKKNPTCLSWLGVGIACFRLDELSESEEALAEANILNNENPEVWGYLSLICLKTERKVEAEQSYKYAIRLGLEQHSETLLDEIHSVQSEVGFGNPEI